MPYQITIILEISRTFGVFDGPMCRIIPTEWCMRALTRGPAIIPISKCTSRLDYKSLPFQAVAAQMASMGKAKSGFRTCGTAFLRSVGDIKWLREMFIGVWSAIDEMIDLFFSGMAVWVHMLYYYSTTLPKLRKTFMSVDSN